MSEIKLPLGQIHVDRPHLGESSLPVSTVSDPNILTSKILYSERWITVEWMNICSGEYQCFTG